MRNSNFDPKEYFLDFLKTQFFLSPPLHGFAKKLVKSFVSLYLIGHQILYPSHEFFTTSITIMGILATTGLSQEDLVHNDLAKNFYVSTYLLCKESLHTPKQGLR